MRKFQFNILFSVLLLSTPLHAQQHEPDIIWKTLSTDHFNIHYPAENVKIAHQTAQICEEIYIPVCETVDFYPKTTEVILHTRSDITNGSAGPLPWRMEIFITDSPENDIGSGDIWLRILLTHEFTHVAHLRKHSGLSSLTRPFLGEFNSFWHILTPPLWLIEGLPTLNETRLTGGGRGRNPNFWMQMAAPYADRNPWRLKNTNYLSRKRAPLGMWYVTGYYLVEHVAKMYGENVWAEILTSYTNNPVAGFGNAVRNVTGKSPAEIYEEVSDSFNESMSDNKHVSRQVLSSRNTILPSYDYSPRWDKKQDELTRFAVYHQDFSSQSRLEMASPDGKRRKIINRVLTHRMNGFSISENYITWSEIKPHPRFAATYYADLFLFDRKSGSTKKLTKSSRLITPDISHDERSVAAVQNYPGGTSLVVIDIKSGSLKPVVNLQGQTIQSPRWSPDGTEIACAVKDENGQQDIYIVNSATGTMNPLFTPDEFHDNQPCWTPDGKHILFSSDRTGKFNIWAVSRQDNRLHQITDEKLGAFSPDVSPNSSELLFNTYSAHGISAAVMKLEINGSNVTAVSNSDKSANRALYKKSHQINAGIRDVSGSNRSYSPWSQIMRPQGRIPWIMKDEDSYAGGLFGMSSDALHRHTWSGLLLYNPTRGKPVYDLGYTYSRWWPSFSLHAFDLPEEVRHQNLTGYWRKRGINLTMSVPLVLERNTYTTQFLPFAGLKTQSYTHSDGPLYPALKDYRGLRAGIIFSRTTQALRDVVPHAGVTAYLTGDWSNESLDSEFSGRQISGLFSLYFPTLIEHHQLQLTAMFQQRSGTFNFSWFGARPEGYSDDRRKNQVRLKAAYHFPIAYIEWAAPLIPFYLDYLAGSFFYDRGNSWNDTLPSWDYRKRYSAGAELTLGHWTLHSIFGTAGARFFYRSWDEKWKSEFFIGFDIPM